MSFENKIQTSSSITKDFLVTNKNKISTSQQSDLKSKETMKCLLLLLKQFLKDYVNQRWRTFFRPKPALPHGEYFRGAHAKLYKGPEVKVGKVK